MNLDGIHIGQLDVRVRIEQPTTTTNATTNETTISGWSTFATVWAKRMRTSSEKLEANQTVAVTGGKYAIRFLEGLNETMRVNDTDIEQYHYIKGIEHVDRKSFLLLTTERRDNVSEG